MNDSLKHALAFPVADLDGFDVLGLSKREVFAGMALQGILANRQYDPPRRKNLDGMAMDAVSAADELIIELERTL